MAWRNLLRGSTMLGLPMAAALAWPTLAGAQPFQGVYIGAGVGYNIVQNQTPTVDAVVAYAAAKTAPTNLYLNGGVAAVGAVGYGFGNGLRAEIEGNYRYNQQQRINDPTVVPAPAQGDETKYGAMANVYYDIDLGANWIYPYIGGGVGYQFTQWNQISVGASGITFQTTPSPVTSTQTIGKLAYQGIVGLSFPIPEIPGLSLTAEYRYLGVSSNRAYRATATFQYAAPAQTRIRVGSEDNHAFMIGLRYAFGIVPNPPPAAVPRTAPPPAFVPQATTRTFLVFFDWDRADLTQRARDIVAEAVRASASTPHTRIEVSGHADRSGTQAYNQAISLRRAEAVAAEMERWGVPRAIIDIRAFGDTRPLVPTAAGVREPQNRRVEIVYR